MNDSARRQGLWSMPGDGVLARRGELILLASIDERGLLDALLALLDRVSDGGGDGRDFCAGVEDLLQRDQTWGGNGGARSRPAVIAFGPADGGLVITVTGSAWADVVTAHGAQRLAAGQLPAVLRCQTGVAVQAIRGSLGTGREGGERTDRFSRLESGTVRAAGLSYHAGTAPAPLAAAAPMPEPSPMPAPPPAAGVAAAAPPPAADPMTPPPAAGPFPGEPFPGEPFPEDVTGEPFPEEPVTGEPFPEEPVTGEPFTGHSRAAEPPAAEPFRAESAGPPPFEEELFAAEEPLAPGPVPAARPFRPPAQQAQVPGFAAAAGAAPVREPAGPPDLPHVPPPSGARPGPGDAAPGAPVVLGVYCKNGHFGDPAARACTVCGASRSRRGPAPQPGPRPPLGALVLDDDSALELDADCVIGRDPAQDPAVAAGDARPLRIVDAEMTVSRVHARVHLDGWQVLLIDLGSANGTRVQLPGKRPEEALQPNVPFPLQSGARVFVGAQGFRYDAGWGR